MVGSESTEAAEGAAFSLGASCRDSAEQCLVCVRELKVWMGALPAKASFWISRRCKDSGMFV